MVSSTQPRIIFAGTPEFAATSLAALLEANYAIQAVFTQPDRPAGRGRQLQMSPVKTVAISANIPIFQPEKLTEEEYQQLRSLKPDLVIVVAYGLLIPERFLTIPRWGFVNVHASLLPRWRGASPIQAAILAGDKETGITLMQMEKGLDTGPMLLQKKCLIESTDTAQDLHDRLAKLGATSLTEGLPQLFSEKLISTPQDNQLATYAKKINKEDAKISWQQDAAMIERQIRAFNPWPVSFTFFLNQENILNALRIWQAESIPTTSTTIPGKIRELSAKGVDVECCNSLLRLTEIQFPGGRRLETSAIANAAKAYLIPGMIFDNTSTNN